MAKDGRTILFRYLTGLLFDPANLLYQLQSFN